MPDVRRSPSYRHLGSPVTRRRFIGLFAVFRLRPWRQPARAPRPRPSRRPSPPLRPRSLPSRHTGAANGGPSSRRQSRREPRRGCPRQRPAPLLLQARRRPRPWRRAPRQRRPRPCGAKKVYKLAVLGDIATMDPAIMNQQVDFQIAETIFNLIGRYPYDPPLGNAITPELAEGWEVQDGARTWIFHLRKGVKFHKGYGDLTAEDVKYNWERIKNPKTASPFRADFGGSTIEALDPYTIKVAFDRPVPFVRVGVARVPPGLRGLPEGASGAWRPLEDESGRLGAVDLEQLPGWHQPLAGQEPRLLGD